MIVAAIVVVILALLGIVGGFSQRSQANDELQKHVAELEDRVQELEKQQKEN